MENKYRNKKYMELCELFLLQHNKPTVEELYEFIIDKEYIIQRECTKSCQKEDIRLELEEQGYTDYTETDVENIWYDYDDNLGENDDWHYILRDTIYDYFERKED